MIGNHNALTLVALWAPVIMVLNLPLSLLPQFLFFVLDCFYEFIVRLRLSMGQFSIILECFEFLSDPELDWFVMVSLQIYFLDTQVWYILVSALIGGFAGARMHLGEVFLRFPSRALFKNSTCYSTWLLELKFALSFGLASNIYIWNTFSFQKKLSFYVYVTDSKPWHVAVTVLFFAGSICHNFSSHQKR